jgi:autotransporter translocation and assembly factor TamB
MGLPQESETASIYEGEADIAGIDAQTRVNVAVELPETTWVRGMGLNARIAGEVQITKERLEAPRYSGTLEVEEGRYTLQGKRFELERGVAMFAGETTAIPDVDIVGIRETDGVRVTAHLTGPANEPKLELTSDPPLDSAEIIALIFFGRSRYSDSDQTFDADGISTTAASIAGVMLVDNIAPELRENLRIDQISVTSGDGDDPPSVEIESQLTPTVYLRLIQSLGASAEEAVEVRWRFWKGFTLKSKVDRSGASSIDLLWQFDYWGFERWGLGGLRTPAPPYRAKTSARCAPPALCPSEGADAKPEPAAE